MSTLLTPAEAAAHAIPDGIVRWDASDRAAWLARRQADVTASAIAALVGEHPYLTAFGLFALKTGATADEEVEPKVAENSVSLPPMMRGTVLEPVAPVVLRMLRPTWEAEPAGFYYRDPAHRIGATPDFFAVDPERPGFGSIQVKTCDQMTLRRSWTVDSAVEPPLFIVIQAVVEAALTGASWCAVAVLVSGHSLDLHLVEVPIHAGLMERLRAEVAAFWRGVEAGQPPKPDYKRDVGTIARLYADDNGEELDLTAENRLPEILATRDGLKAEIKTASEAVDEIDAEFKHRLGHHQTALLAGGRRATWKTQHRKGFTVEPASFRVLRFLRARS